ncbi:uncharacterized protein LOC110367479 [Fundulus heteroclitus]|uniref:uncharacterized protein LOC110367479 n=1 Tax=Fundulus heteroclitus TaxID=8078 RepID=UPI00165CD07D|nr:uncharacterized protein LOC110367479 [Fundulus heteroclitus]XP_035984758.1 uncharacterized protein LOC110367479 [Fundulus heteroclitus]
MGAFRRIIVTLFQIRMLQFTAAAGHQSFITVKAGAEETLPCKNVIQGQTSCENAEWTFTVPGGPAELWFQHGHLTEAAKRKADRLSVKADCSLNIKNITAEDAGLLICRQIFSGHQHERSEFYLSVITIAEQRDNNKVTFNCAVSGHYHCRHTVKWLYEGDEKSSSDRPQSCSDTVTFHLHQDSTLSGLLWCYVTEQDTGRVHLTSLYPQFSGESSENPKMATTGWPWWCIPVALGVSLIIFLAVVRWKKMKGKRRQLEESTLYSYATINFLRQPDEREKISTAVTYSSVKASSCAAGASIRPNSIYSTVR